MYTKDQIFFGQLRNTLNGFYPETHNLISSSLKLIPQIFCCRRNKALLRELSTPPPDSQKLHFPSKYSRSYFTQCKACLWKQHKSYWRNTPYNAVRLVFSTSMAIIFGVIFQGLGTRRYVRTCMNVAEIMNNMLVLSESISNSLKILN